MIGTLVFLVSYSAAPMLAAPPGAQRWDIQATDHFEIYYRAPQGDHVRALADQAERAYARISLALRHDFEAKMPVILVAQDRDLPRNEQQAVALVTASGAPERHHLLVSAQTLENRAAVALAHELTHQFVFELLPQADRDAPWVSEALADHQSGSWEPVALAKVRAALAHGGVPAVEDLAASDRHWGHAVFDFVAAEYGAQGVRRYLAALGGGPAARGEAIRVAFGQSPDAFNAAFQRYVRAHF
jgi:hypothetical protein